MSASVRDLLVRGVAAAKAGDRQEARFYLEWALNLNEASEKQQVEAWLWLAEISEDPDEQREYLDSVLAVNPFNPRARRKLAILEGNLQVEDLIDPDALEEVEQILPSHCPECSSALIYAPEGEYKLCERCGWRPQYELPVRDEPQNLLAQGIVAAKERDWRKARHCLESVIQLEDAPTDLQLQAWLWLSGVTEDFGEKKRCLQAVLELDPDHQAAREGLAFLATQSPARPAPEIDEAAVDEEVEGRRPQLLSALQTQRFICVNCGGKMAFDPESKRLACGYCGHTESLLSAARKGALVEERDFILALATAEGHARPVGMQSFECQGCGASFVLGSGVLSISCPYCGSAHVADVGTRDLIAPEGLIPFAFSQEEAQGRFRQWIQQQAPREATIAVDVTGLYLPVWTFDVGGALKWTSVVVEHVNGVQQSYQKEGKYYLDCDDVLVLASHLLPSQLAEIKEDFDLSAVTPYDARYLADWPAEIYDVSASSASLVARQWVVERGRELVSPQVAPGKTVDNTTLDSSELAIYAYKLLLLPLWLGQYGYEGQRYHVVINGQTGRVRAEQPANLLQKIWRRFFK